MASKSTRAEIAFRGTFRLRMGLYGYTVISDDVNARDRSRMKIYCFCEVGLYYMESVFALAGAYFAE
jgi:hypothetical protein